MISDKMVPNSIAGICGTITSLIGAYLKWIK